MFTLHDVTESMMRAEIHLAVARHKDGGRIRLTWIPWANSFHLVHSHNGEEKSKRTSPTVVPLLTLLQAEALPPTV